MTPGEIAMAIAMGVLLIAGGYAIAYRAGRNREREREPSEAALFAGHADADAVDGERRMLAMLEEAVIVTDSSANVLVANEAAIERGLSVDGLIVDAGIRRSRAGGGAIRRGGGTGARTRPRFAAAACGRDRAVHGRRSGDGGLCRHRVPTQRGPRTA